MPFTIKGEIQGLEDLLKSLEGMKKGRTRILKPAVQAAGRVIRQAARAFLKTGEKSAKKAGRPRSGLLRRSLAVKTVVYRSRGTVVAIIGPRSDMKDAATGENPANIAHFVELGRKAVVIKDKKILSDGTTVFGTRVQAAPAQPFLRPALDTTHGQVRQVMEEAIAKQLEKEAARKFRDSGGDDGETTE